MLENTKGTIKKG